MKKSNNILLWAIAYIQRFTQFRILPICKQSRPLKVFLTLRQILDTKLIHIYFPFVFSKQNLDQMTDRSTTVVSI